MAFVVNLPLQRTVTGVPAKASLRGASSNKKPIPRSHTHDESRSGDFFRLTALAQERALAFEADEQIYLNAPSGSP